MGDDEIATLNWNTENPTSSPVIPPEIALHPAIEQSCQEELDREDQLNISDMWAASGQEPHQELFLNTLATTRASAQFITDFVADWCGRPFIHPQVLRDLQTLQTLTDKEPRMLIGIYSPKPQSGKTTAADALVLAGFNHQRFAGPMKDMARTVLTALGVPEIGLYQGDKEELVYRDRTLRHLLQTLGTEWGRKCMGEDFWVDLWRARVEASGGLIVADDMRFPNEYRAIKALGGVVWRVTRPDNTSPTNGHASEGALDGLSFDLELVNDGTLDQFKTKVDAAVRIAKEVA